MNTSELISRFYDQGHEDARLTSPSGAVEFIVTTHYIDRYLKKGDRILEIGCGTGRYALHYARQGHPVDALDLSEVNLEVLRSRIRPGDDIRVCQGNALDLSRFDEGAFDMTLLLGPMYHLFTERDKLTCLNEALRVTKSGGLLYVAYCQFDASMIQQIFSGKRLYDSVVQNGLLDEEKFLPVSRPEGLFELYRQEQIDALDERLEADRLHYVGSDMFTRYRRSDIDSLDERLYEKYIAYTLSICEKTHLVGASNHTLDVLRKR